MGRRACLLGPSLPLQTTLTMRSEAFPPPPVCPRPTFAGPYRQPVSTMMMINIIYLTLELLDLSLIHIVLVSAATVRAEDHYDVLPIRKGMIGTVLWHLTGIMRW